MDFTYTENIAPHQKYLEAKLTDCLCKHVMDLSSEKAKAVADKSIRIGYPQAIWGYGSEIYKNPEEDRIIQLQTIRKMIYKQWNRPYRIVIDYNGALWIDNLHSAIRDIIVYGKDTRILNTQFYLIDLSDIPPIVVNYKNNLDPSLKNVKGAILASVKRANRANGDIRNIGYTIGEFMQENKISKDAINLSENHYRNYRLTEKWNWNN